MTSLLAPPTMTRREAVADLLKDVPRPAVDRLRIEFAAEQFPTTSFVDELIRQTLHVGLARQVDLVGADPFTADLARTAAERYEVADRLRFA